MVSSQNALPESCIVASVSFLRSSTGIIIPNVMHALTCKRNCTVKVLRLLSVGYKNNYERKEDFHHEAGKNLYIFPMK